MSWDFDRHVEVFNRAVADNDWDEYVALFADDAVVEFDGPPVGPFVGRDQIADAYRRQPPDDTLELIGAPAVDGPDDAVAFRWQRGGATGLMRVRAVDGVLDRLVVRFDEEESA